MCVCRVPDPPPMLSTLRPPSFPPVLTEDGFRSWRVEYLKAKVARGDRRIKDVATACDGLETDLTFVGGADAPSPMADTHMLAPHLPPRGPPPPIWRHSLPWVYARTEGRPE